MIIINHLKILHIFLKILHFLYKVTRTFFQAGSDLVMKNYKESIKDSLIYIILIKQIAPAGSGVSKIAALAQEDRMERAEETLKMAEKINCRYDFYSS